MKHIQWPTICAKKQKNEQKKRQAAFCGLPCSVPHTIIFIAERVFPLTDAWWRFLPNFRPRCGDSAALLFLHAQLYAIAASSSPLFLGGYGTYRRSARPRSWRIDGPAYGQKRQLRQKCVRSFSEIPASLPLRMPSSCRMKCARGPYACQPGHSVAQINSLGGNKNDDEQTPVWPFGGRDRRGTHRQPSDRSGLRRRQAEGRVRLCRSGVRPRLQLSA